MQREFQREISEKEQEASEIEDHISETKQHLNRLRHAIILNYYKSSSVEIHQEVQRSLQNSSLVPSGVDGFDQMPLHPSLKKLIGKKPLPQFTNERMKRKATQEATCSSNNQLTTSMKSNEPTRKEASTTCVTEPKIVKLTSSRGKHQVQQLIVVGNTSQYLKEQSSEVTHKWMCYVRSKSSTPIVKKVSFHLDSSYKPNDVINVDVPPFQITRRSLFSKEFDVKVVVTFHDELATKPVQIFHKLMLDQKCSGHQTLGNETLCEFWSNDVILSDDRTFVSKEEVCTHVIDHNYFKIRKDEESEPTKSDERNSIKGRALAWMNSQGTCNLEQQDSSELQIEENEPEEDDQIVFPVNFRLERTLIESSLKGIGFDPTSFEETSIMVMIIAMRSFSKDLLEKASCESLLKGKEVVETSDINKTVQTMSEFEFLNI